MTCPCSDLDNIYCQLLRLRPELVNLIFQEKDETYSINRRKPEGYARIFEALGKEGDIEALTACIGLIQEAKHYDYERFDFIYTGPTFRVLCRSLAERPYSYISEEFYTYLMNNILNNPIGYQIRDKISERIIGEYVWLNEIRLSIVDDFDIFKGAISPPRSCLHIAEKYLTPSVIQRILDPDDKSDIHKYPELKNLLRALKRWEKNRSMTAH